MYFKASTKQEKLIVLEKLVIFVYTPNKYGHVL